MKGLLMSNQNKRGKTTREIAREKKRRARRQDRETRRRKKKRSLRIKALTESDPDMPMMEIICQTKTGFIDKATALRKIPPTAFHVLSVYECDVCMGWHFTSNPTRDPRRLKK